MEKILFIRMDALFPMLFWGNMIALLFLLIYLRRHRFSNDRRALTYLALARLAHTFYYFVASGRDILPDWLSVNLGNTMLFAGFYFEAQAILRIIREGSRSAGRMLFAALAVSVAAFNAVEFAFPFGGVRIATASACVVAIMALPVIRMLLFRNSGIFVKSTAAFYAVFLSMLLMRVWYGLQYRELGILTTNILQSVTFLALLLQLIIALPAYAIILKDYAEEALVRMATTDRLTGAANRHAFMDAALAAHKHCERFRIPLAALFIDIDHFKQVNDRYGHAFGDSVLARLAAVIGDCLRKSDLNCRYGGEEFVAFLPRSDCSGARLVAERIMNEVRNVRFEERPDFAFTVSIGVFCGVPFPGQTFDSIIHAADEALYEAKRAGRNRIVLREMAGK